ncbi:MAG: transcriptional repressor [Roseburia sp.]|nr:transcriptional repressor [Roseburia sp.]
MANCGYATANRKKILDFLKENHNRTLTVADIDAHLKACDSEVNITTIYRYLDKLEKEGTVIKYVAEKGSQATYQYVEQGHNCEEHLHLQCVKCGSVIHLECHFMHEILEHVEKEHGFIMQCKNSIVYGTCRECTEK